MFTGSSRSIALEAIGWLGGGGEKASSAPLSRVEQDSPGLGLHRLSSPF